MSDIQKDENINNAPSDGGPVKPEVTPEAPAVKMEEPATPKQEKTSISPKKRGNTNKDDAASAKKKRSPAKTKKADAEAGEGEEEVVAPQTPRKRKASGAPATPGRTIPANIEEADQADRMLLKMKDEGSTWPEIRTAWEELTGEPVGNSTLPNRYNRIKANFVQFTEEDMERLQEAKIEVETKFNTEKWAKIAEAMEGKGSQKFSTATIQKKVKELEKKVVVNDTAAVKAED